MISDVSEYLYRRCERTAEANMKLLTWSPAVLTVSVVKKRCISRSAKQKMQSAVASIHQLQAISCCKQESRPAVDTTDGSAGVAEPAGALKRISWRSLSCCKQESRPAVDTTDGSAGVAEPADDYVESSVDRYAYVSYWYNEEKTYQLLFKVKKKRTADEIYKEEPTAEERYKENQQLSEQLLSEV
ncbi:pre-mRNA-processing factor 39 [Dorcoceras hygrometricum]|uniref:Pre-mRNA-processing factor 39 n=1 Tax=Dorcoceras hygrometricum TaxID=472368 RepID=A0A2Z7CVL6_9LAMI|nr:pre-mRNA-processing factor 39 [Dorcoceras hygrometricum]